jgi:hypothetical protein
MQWQKRNLTRNIRIQESRESPKEYATTAMRKGLECNSGIRRQDVKEPPHLRTWRKTAISVKGMNRRQQPRLEGVRKCNGILWKTFRLEILK